MTAFMFKQSKRQVYMAWCSQRSEETECWTKQVISACVRGALARVTQERRSQPRMAVLAMPGKAGKSERRMNGTTIAKIFTSHIVAHNTRRFMCEGCERDIVVCGASVAW